MSLENQTIPLDRWELVLVDNASNPPIERMDFKLPSNCRIVSEARPGLTNARLCGINSTTGNLIIFVDDDNLLAEDYLERSLEVSNAFPFLGVWGGRSLPEFELTPPNWMKPFWANLALHDFIADRWTNQKDFSCFPCGAGMCIRRDLAEEWAARTRTNLLSLSLGRTGKALASGEDTDIVLGVIAAGWGIGKFTDLSLTHIIPKERLTLEYHCRLAHGMGISIGQINGRDAQTNPLTIMGLLRGFLGVLFTHGPARKVRWAAFRAYRRGLEMGYRSR